MSLKYVSLLFLQDEEVGGFMVKQNLSGYPVAVFRFPARLRISSGQCVTIYSGDESKDQLHQPPTSFVCEDSQQWSGRADRTTILCKADGQVYPSFIFLFEI